MTRRAWTLDGAREMLVEVRRRTQFAVEAADAIQAPADSDAARARLDEIASRWAREMEALGVEAQGPWRVDFDNGSGYYCWQWPESELAYFHGHDEGFASRTRIQ